jgi:rod shape-determining protein MreD
LNPNNLIGPVVISLIVAVIFQLIPVSGSWILWRPNFLMLTMVAWILYQPNYFGIGFAALVGLLADTLFRTGLGHYVMVFAVCGAIAYLLSRWLTYFAYFHRAVLIFLLVVVAQLLEAVLFSFWDVPMDFKHVPILGLTSAIAWFLVDKFVASLNSSYR